MQDSRSSSPASDGPLPGTGGWAPTLVLAAIPVVVAATLFSSTLDDDAYITFASARALAEEGAWVNVNGERVEASSTPLFVLLLALVQRLLGELALWAPIVSALAAALCVGAVHRVGRGIEARGPSVALLAASCLPLTFWSLSGMETSLHAALIVIVVGTWATSLERGGAGRLVAAGLAGLGLVAVRPEGAPILLCASATWILVEIRAGRRSGRGTDDVDPGGGTSATGRAVVLFLLAVAAVLVVFTVRYVIYGTWFPQPVAAKVGGLSRRRVIEGLTYLWSQGVTGSSGGLLLLGAVCGLTVLGQLARGMLGTRVGRASGLAVVFLVASGGFLVTSGGDWMIAGRFLVAPLALSALVVGGSLSRCSLRCRVLVVGGLCVLQLAGCVWFARTGSPSMPLWCASAGSHPDATFFERRNRHRLHDVELAEVLGELVDRLDGTGPGPVRILTGQLGLVPYRVAAERSGRVRFIDRYGLATTDFTDCEVSAHNPRGSAGLVVTYGFFFEHLEALEACGIGAPEVIFDWSSPAVEKLLARHGYRPWYRQSGSIENGSTLLPGMEVRPHEVIFVREELLEGLEPPTGGAERSY